MGGMEMLMKSFGVDPENIKNQVTQAGDDFKKVVKHFDERLNKIESVINVIDENQLKIMACLKIEPVIAPNNVQLVQNFQPTEAGDAPHEQ